jgi:hypothetical protein
MRHWKREKEEGERSCLGKREKKTNLARSQAACFSFSFFFHFRLFLWFSRPVYSSDFQQRRRRIEWKGGKKKRERKKERKDCSILKEPNKDVEKRNGRGKKGKGEHPSGKGEHPSGMLFNALPRLFGVKRDLLQCQKRPTIVSKETFYSVKRDLL